MIGKTISHYRIEAELGRGGMGAVYRARDEQLDRDVALKILPIGGLADETARKRFRKEALALAKLSHPNIGVVPSRVQLRQLRAMLHGRLLHRGRVPSIPLEVERRFSDPIRIESGCKSSEKGENRRGKTISLKFSFAPA